jgi:hypothetical protein
MLCEPISNPMKKWNLNIRQSQDWGNVIDFASRLPAASTDNREGAPGRIILILKSKDRKSCDRFEWQSNVVLGQAGQRSGRPDQIV